MAKVKEYNVTTLVQEVLLDIDPNYQDRSSVYIQKSKRDIEYTLDFTMESIRTNEPNILINYYKWLIETLSYYNISEKSIQKMFESIQEKLSVYLTPQEKGFLMQRSFQEILEEKKASPYHEIVMSVEVSAYLDCLLRKDRKGANDFILQLLQNDYTIEQIFVDILQNAMREIGRLWQVGKITVADEHMATVITQYVMTQLYPYIFGREKNGLTMVGLALGSELHELGIRMITDLFEYHGYETHYMGANMPLEGLFDYLVENKPNLLAVSATMTTNISALKELISKIKADPNLEHLKILVGGQALYGISEPAMKVGADAYAIDAKEALKVGDKLVKE